MALLRMAARIPRFMRLLLVIACFSFFGAAIFIIGMIIHSLGSVSFGSWRVFRDVSAVFAIIGALYGSVIALDRSAEFPWPRGKVFRRVNAPFVRTGLCSILGAAAVAMVQSWHGASVMSWLFVGAGAGAVLGWFGWRWAKYVEF
jgi:hypothetical protein